MPHRLKRALAAFVVAGTALLAAPSFAGFESTGAVAHFILANGLELVVLPDHRTAVVTHMIWYKVGSADESPGKSGTGIWWQRRK